ncbi:MAG: hypothetical protein WDA09_06975 [Bacteriovoracaceae bacterium]
MSKVVRRECQKKWENFLKESFEEDYSMKIQLNSQGNLFIERAGEFKMQICPFASTEDDIPCGDHCPLFAIDEDRKALHLCQKTYNYSQLSYVPAPEAEVDTVK